MDIKNRILNSDYDFLRQDSNLGDKVCLLAVGGSRAYGTNHPDSDLDIRGICLTPVDTLIGAGSDFELFEDRHTDTVIYTVNKIFGLLAKCNPNVIEILGCRQQDYLYTNEIGELILSNKEIFISKQAYSSFYGYAQAQMIRLENAIMGNHEEESLNVLEARLNNKIQLFKEKFKGFDCSYSTSNGTLTLDMSTNKSYINTRDLKTVINELETIANSINSVGHRSSRVITKGRRAVCKHAAHLLRLYMMCIDILLFGEINTYRLAEHNLLMDCIGGRYITDDIRMTPDFYLILREYDIKMKEALKNSKLPDRANSKAINELLKVINRYTLYIS